MAAVEAGADAIGLVFYAKSPRAVTVQQARAIISALPPFVTSVGLFVDASRCELGVLLDAVPLDCCSSTVMRLRLIVMGITGLISRRCRVKPGDDIAAQVELYKNASGVLLDTYRARYSGRHR